MWREFYHWLSTSRYTRSLEARVENLELENQALRNALNERAGVPRIDFKNREVMQAKNPVPIRKPITWSSFRRKLEADSHQRAVEKAKNQGAN